MDDELIKDFLVESREGLDQLDRDLVALEQNPQDKQILGAIFRTIHTIKGTCGFLGFAKLESVAHAGENLLSLLRDGALNLNPKIATGLLDLVDAIRQMLDAIETGDANSGDDYSTLVDKLKRLQAGEDADDDVPAEDDNVVKEFVVESREGLDQVDRYLVGLEDNPDDTSTLAAIFRTIHAIKGTSGYLGYTRLESLTNAGETLLRRLRDGQLRFTQNTATVLLQMVDAVRHMLESIGAGQGDEAYDCTQLLAQLDALSAAQTVAEAAVPAPAPAQETAARPTLAPPVQSAPVQSAPVQSAPVQSPPVQSPPRVDATPRVPPVAALATAVPAAPPRIPTASAQAAPVPAAPVAPPPAPRSSAPISQPASPAAEVSGAAKPAAASAASSSQARPARGARPVSRQTSEVRATSGSAAADTIRVDVQLLDKVMNLVGELVLVRNQVLQSSDAQDDPAFQRLNLVTTELQEAVMKTRMQPIGNAWGKFPRLVRDLAVACGKKLRLEMEGQETELDKSLLEAIKDPLTHLVRNAADHGIELPDVRLAAGKAPEGRLKLRAYHEGGQVNIEISDDGAGLNPDKLRRKALDRGLISQDQASRMSDRELANLIFLPGFSTAEKVTNVSGRGVGMDVVKTNIEKIGGTVDVHSVVGHGTTLKIKIPLTLAIIPALIVRAGGNRFAIPQVSLVELVRLEGERINRVIENIHGAPVYRLRGQLLPLAYLDQQLGLDRIGQAGLSGNPEQLDVMNIVVLQADERQFGLVVDEVSDTEEIVVKPLGKQIKGINAFAGATIMGDGRVALILDVMGVAQRAHIIAEMRNRALVDAAATPRSEETDGRQTLLLCSAGDGGRLAIPLAAVARLEEIPYTRVEQAGNQDVVQYRGQILPLVHLDQLLPERRSAPRGPQLTPEQDDMLQVVVCFHDDGGGVGLVVGQIVDIVQDPLKVQRKGGRLGVNCSVVIQNRVTELLDVNAVIKASGCSPSENLL